MTEQPPETGILGYDVGIAKWPTPKILPFPKTQTQDTHQEACGIHD